MTWHLLCSFFSLWRCSDAQQHLKVRCCCRCSSHAPRELLIWLFGSFFQSNHPRRFFLKGQDRGCGQVMRGDGELNASMPDMRARKESSQCWRSLSCLFHRQIFAFQKAEQMSKALFCTWSDQITSTAFFLQAKPHRWCHISHDPIHCENENIEQMNVSMCMKIAG